ncbi:MAG: hypothetical protein Q9165_002738 [Trypethelium subeluteriae]
MDVKPEPKRPIYLEWVTAAHDFDRQVWPALCHQAYELEVFPHSDFYPKTLHLIPSRAFGGMSYESLRDALRKVDVRHKFVNVDISPDPESPGTARSPNTHAKATIVILDYCMGRKSNSGSAGSCRPKPVPRADAATLESSARGSHAVCSMDAVSARFSRLNLDAEVIPPLKLRQKNSALPKVRHSSRPSAVEDEWTTDEDAKLMELKNDKVMLWSDAANGFPNRSIGSLLQRYGALILKGNSQASLSGSPNLKSETNVPAARQLESTAVESTDAKCSASSNPVEATVREKMQAQCSSPTTAPQAQSETVEIVEDVASIDSHVKTQSKAVELGQWDMIEAENEPEWEFLAE